jgi:RNA polymerase sigma-70 factor (ECF subfamily)
MSLTNSSTSASLLDQVRRGDQEAWNRFAAIYVPLVYRWARQAGLQENDAKDVSQEVFLSVVKNLSAFRKEEADQSLRAWLRTITKNSVIDNFRRKKRQIGESWVSRAEPEWQGDETDEAAAEREAERRLLLRRAFETVQVDFEPTTWQMFWQAVVEEIPAAEVAARQGVSAWAVYKARSRVLARVREVLADYYPARAS